MPYPTVTCFMPTYGRAARQPAVIAEAVRSFVTQTYPFRELLIVNDCAEHVLWTTVPGVRIVNLKTRASSLGTKCNIMLGMAMGEIGLMWEDDDVSLPHRIGQAVDQLGTEYDYWNPKLWWYEQKGRARVADGNGVGHNCSAFRVRALAGHYPDVSKGHDGIIDGWAKKNVRVNPTKLTNPDDISYVYRWGWSDFHLSAQADMDRSYESASPGPPGRYEVTT